MTIHYLKGDFSSLRTREFALNAIFGTDWPDKAFLVNSPDWGRRKRLENLDDTRDCYWCVGAISWGKDRNNENVEDVRALVLDDVGTKINPMDALFRTLDVGAPILITETSKNNFQYVYRFEKAAPVREFNRFRRGLLKDLKAGDGKDAAHLFRLPWGINCKPGRERFPVTGRMGLSNDLPTHTPNPEFWNIKSFIPPEKGAAL